MGEKDMTTKILEDHNDVFADIMNVLLFDKQVIQEEYLEKGPTESIYKAEDEQEHEQRRDVLKRYNGVDYTLLSLGIENQSKIDKSMPLRVMGYDYASYRGQLRVEKTLHPVVTLVLNLSGSDWNAPISLLEMMQIPEDLKGRMPDYKCHVIDVHRLSEETIVKFKSDFGAVARFFKYGDEFLDKVKESERIIHIRDLIRMIGVFSSRDLSEVEKDMLEMEQKGQVVTMCTIVQDIEAKGEARGEARGEEKGELKTYVKFVNKKLVTIEQAAKDLNISVEEFKKRAEKFGLL